MTRESEFDFRQWQGTTQLPYCLWVQRRLYSKRYYTTSILPLGSTEVAFQEVLHNFHTATGFNGGCIPRGATQLPYCLWVQRRFIPRGTEDNPSIIQNTRDLTHLSCSPHGPFSIGSAVLPKKIRWKSLIANAGSG
jgi:hypothetical protein